VHCEEFKILVVTEFVPVMTAQQPVTQMQTGVGKQRRRQG
jgi:hypothetical protein